MCRKWGTLQIDLFASHLNAQLTIILDQEKDALLVNWSHWFTLAFSPIPLFIKVIQEVKIDQAEMILIAPFCPEGCGSPG